MENLWAPWRMTYILEEDKPEGCIFCLAVDGKGADDLVLGVGEHSLVMMNKYPYNNGHLLVAPRRHLPGLDRLSDLEMTDLLSTVRRAVNALKEVMNPEGFNVGLNLGRVAGAGIEEHMHFHVVPRWGGDTNFMTVFGEVRVIPEHIRATCDKLRPYFADLK
ncbi:MAG: HIT domain-containing protein [Desulfarculaceae bacterium]|nr:HIT domain-containing protein [Desulfarculaceae bacterium]MCF8071841.1 HIT domain-containing protein [Desulfarculaceae bacterium]MCF8101391.1 HIT domain-containing protein [Desulfarculaceae bacterium]MCF8117382.1 HIT domain-containing protein [Desulfarculaceae bacterium]